MNDMDSLEEGALEWPYPVNYGKENEIITDILVIGGGLAGCNAAINAAKTGASVAIVDKAPIIRSGSAGAGIDHWHDICTAPCCKVSPDEMIELSAAHTGFAGGYTAGHTSYITFQESWDALLDLEKMGLKIRDEDDEFVGAEFRDEETKLLFSYDYENKHSVRIQGALLKPVLYKELKKLAAGVYDHIMITGLLTEDGRPGSRIVGAMGFHVRNGEFFIFKAKATVLATAHPSHLWVYSTELVGSQGEHSDPNCVGDGHAMAWQAGAEFTLMECSTITGGAFRYPAYGGGSWHNTWFPCSMVDANGKEIPWVDWQGNPVKTVTDRCRPAPGQKIIMGGPPTGIAEMKLPGIIPDLHERIKKGEYALPLYADLPSMSEHERRAIFGLMVAHEGKTRIPVYERYTQAGFDPDKDMLQAVVMRPDSYRYPDWHQAKGMGAPQWRSMAYTTPSGIVVDWDLKTNLAGLYAAGAVARAGSCSGACCSGRYAGRKAAEYSRTAPEPVIVGNQVEEEKSRIYAPVNRNGSTGWKELYAGTARIMQDYCGEYKNEETLKMGLKWLQSIKESEADNVMARNPHELMRALECMSRITVGEMVMHASLARKASSKPLGLNRLDFPEIDPPEWNKFTTIRLDNDEIKTGELPLDYWLLPPNAPGYKENYEQHCGL